MLETRIYSSKEFIYLHQGQIMMLNSTFVRPRFKYKILAPLIILLFLLVIPFSLLSQENTLETQAEEAFVLGNYSKSEKIWKQIAEQKAKEKDIKGEVDALLQVATSCLYVSKFDVSARYAKLSAKKAKENNLTIEYGHAMHKVSIVFEFLEKRDSLKYACQEILNTPGLTYNYYSDAYTLLYGCYGNSGELDKQELCIKKAIQLDRVNRDSSSLPFNLVYLGEIKMRNNLHSEALELYYEAISFIRPKKDKFKLAGIYSHISSLFRTLHNFDKSEEYGLKILTLCDELNLPFTKVVAFNELGATAQKQKQFVEALDYYQRSDSIFSERGGRMSFQLNVKISIGECLLAIGRFEVAELIIEEIRDAVYLNQDNKKKLDFAVLDAEYNLFINPINALQKIKIAEELNRDLENIYSENKIYDLYAQYYKQQDEYKKSIFYSDKSDALKDSIYRNDQAFVVHNLEALYQKKEQESAITLLATQNELQTTQLKAQRIIIFTSIAGILIFGALVFFISSLLKKVKSQKQVVETSLEEKEVLLKEIHHRVKNNLQVISSMLALQSKYITDDGALSALKQGQDRVFSMALIHQILYEGENLIGVVTTDYFEHLADNLSYSYDVDEKVTMALNIEEMKLDVDTIIPLGLIVNELVVNCFKHAFDKSTKAPKIQINLRQESKYLVLEVKDNGGILTSTDEIDGKSFGFELIKAFAKKLYAKIDLKLDQGLSVKLQIERYKSA